MFNLQPREIGSSSDGRSLVIAWSDNSKSEISARELRPLCPCVECSSGRSRGDLHELSLLTDSAVTIDNVDLPSSSSILVRWKDGHDKSLYRFEFLFNRFKHNQQT